MDPPTTAGTVAHAATLAATAAAYLRVFDPLDAKAILSILGDSYRYEFAPASLDPPPALDAPGFDAHLARMRRVMRSFPVREIRSWPNPSLNQVVVWARSEAFFHDRIIEGASGGPSGGVDGPERVHVGDHHGRDRREGGARARVPRQQDYGAAAGLDRKGLQEARGAGWGWLSGGAGGLELQVVVADGQPTETVGSLSLP
ncbi:uncharacterized protein E0L32_007639 [Thyridium curvatum]|uniref:Uncharacterized protein n=1 Tax=Thyridium curvatum TaxID=1093900 RepID=A0A507B4Z2_9PEZI|nr:uncharacterized protein E0L32_007639 [Thyridium curvatum]TPX11660.1 hypothetical protein E0L32_007639 [Thyridium curvatum]